MEWILVGLMAIVSQACVTLPSSFTEARGGLVHTPSQIRFLDSVGSFSIQDKDTDVQILNSNTRDVAVTYNYLPAMKVLFSSSARPATVSVFVYPKVEGKDYETSRADVFSFHRDAKLVRQEAVALPAGNENLRGVIATFRYQTQVWWPESLRNVNAGDAQPVVSRLAIFEKGAYFLKFRITYPEEDGETYERAATDFIPQFLKEQR